MTRMAYTNKTICAHDRRWLIISIGLIVQVAVMAIALISLRQFGQPNITLAPVAGRNDVCRIASVATFTDAWVNGIQPGMLVRSFKTHYQPYLIMKLVPS